MPTQTLNDVLREATDNYYEEKARPFLRDYQYSQAIEQALAEVTHTFDNIVGDNGQTLRDYVADMVLNNPAYIDFCEKIHVVVNTLMNIPEGLEDDLPLASIKEIQKNGLIGLALFAFVAGYYTAELVGLTREEND